MKRKKPQIHIGTLGDFHGKRAPSPQVIYWNDSKDGVEAGPEYAYSDGFPWTEKRPRKKPTKQKRKEPAKRKPKTRQLGLTTQKRATKKRGKGH